MVAERLAALLGFDYQKILNDRLMHLLSPDEVGQLSQDISAPVDFQLHTHNHRVPGRIESAAF